MIDNDSDIIICGAAENNLKRINIRIPLNKIICITGKSGSGKSSLIEKVIAKESQRLQEIVEGTASEYDKYVRADFKAIKNLPNSVLIKQASVMRTDSSSVATRSGVSDGLRKLFYIDGEIICHCGRNVENTVHKDKIVKVLKNILGEEQYQFCSLIIKNKKIDISIFERFVAEHVIDKFIVEGKNKIYDVKGLSSLGKHKNFTVKALIGNANKENLTGLNLECFPIKSLQVYHENHCFYNFKYHTFCYSCYSLYKSKSISMFTRTQLSKDSGSCLTCAGKGSNKKIDLLSLLNFEKSIIDAKFLNLPNNGKAYKYVYLQNSDIRKFAAKNNIITDIAFINLKDSDQYAVIDFLEKNLNRYLDHDKLQEFVLQENCLDCKGSGFNHYTLSVRYRNKTIADVLKLTVAEAALFFCGSEFEPILNALCKLSLSHLILDRRTNTLSGGELQRLKLAAIIIQSSGSLLLIIDEPSVGLHCKDINNLLAIFKDLVAKFNTLLIVDHNPWIIANSDYQMEIGPGSGLKGGQLVSVHKTSPITPQISIKPSSNTAISTVSYRNINFNNIYQQSFDFPIYKLVCLVGVSGSGKSSLATYMANNSQNYFDDVISLNQFSIGKNKRSTIASYLGITDRLRTFYSITEQSQFLDLSKCDFSSNSQAGACEVCNGTGEVNNSLCYHCGGKKFNSFILSVTIDNINIVQFLQTPIDELAETAPSLFSDRKLNKALTILIDIGLGHLTLGREIPSISGGEAQRIKLANYLVKNNSVITDTSKHNLLILDEPSQGLNSEDTLIILSLLNKLVNYKNSLLVIEHNNIIIGQSDFVIELGPYAGNSGGEITFSGQAEDYFDKISEFRTVIERQNESLSKTKIYPSAILNNQVDKTYFEKLEKVYKSYKLVSEDSAIIKYFVNRENMYQYCTDNLHDEKYFINPFSSFFIKLPLISRNDIESTLLRLKKFMLEDIYIDGKKIDFSKADKLIDNTNCWNVLVRVKDFNQAFNLGSGWVVIKKDNSFINLSVVMLSLKNRIFSNKVLNIDSLNPFFNKCNYCEGEGHINFSDGLIINPHLSVLDSEFYHSDFSTIIESKLLRKLKVIVSTFKHQKLFDFSKPFNEFTEQDLIIYNHGLPGHSFLKEGGRKTALGDMIAWSGMASFLIDNVKYFSEQQQKRLHNIFTSEPCLVCGGSKYNQRLSYYFSQNTQ